MSEPTRYPLAWPGHRPRKTAAQRKVSKFRSSGSNISLSGALDRLEAELERMGARYVLISTNVEPRLDGRPRSGQPKPQDPGVCVYFTLAGKPIALACDSYTTVEGNIAALAAHVEATRAIERHGVATAAETLQAFSALPPPTGMAPAPVQRPWRVVLGFSASFPQELTAGEAELLVRGRYRTRAAELGPEHPDLLELNVARDAALKELGA